MAKLVFYRGILKIGGRLTGVTVRELSDEKLERRARQEQPHHRERLRQAVACALAAMADPNLRAAYIKRLPGNAQTLTI
jgi:hypothetical protein